MEAKKERIVVFGLGDVQYGDEGFGIRVAERLHGKYTIEELMAAQDTGLTSIAKLSVEIVDEPLSSDNMLYYFENTEKLLIIDAVDFGLEYGALVNQDLDFPVSQKKEIQRASDISVSCKADERLYAGEYGTMYDPELCQVHTEVKKEEQSSTLDYLKDAFLQAGSALSSSMIVEEGQEATISHDTIDTSAYILAHARTAHANEVTEALGLAIRQNRVPPTVHILGMQPVRAHKGDGLSAEALNQLDKVTNNAAQILQSWGVTIEAKETSLLDMPSFS